VVIVIFPIRCFSCGNVISEVYDEYKTRLSNVESPEEILNDLGVTKYCCRRMFASHRLENGKELFDDIVEYR
jgi:DNA-directed RNA polymerase subunit N